MIELSNHDAEFLMRLIQAFKAVCPRKTIKQANLIRQARLLERRLQQKLPKQPKHTQQ